MKKYLIIFAFLALAFGVNGCGGQTAIAEINGKAITSDDLGRAIDQLRQEYNGVSFPETGTSEFAEVKKRVTQRLINDEVFRLEADKMGISVSDEEVNAQVDQQRKTFGGEEHFVKTLSEQGTTEAQFTENLRKSLLFKMIYAEVTKENPSVTDDEALQYYSQNQESFRKPEDFSQVKGRIKDKIAKEHELSIFQRWLDEARDRYEIIIKDEYQTIST